MNLVKGNGRCNTDVTSLPSCIGSTSAITMKRVQDMCYFMFKRYNHLFVNFIGTYTTSLFAIW